MEVPLLCVPDFEVRSVIKFLVAEKVPVPEIHRRLTLVYGEGTMSIEMVRSWKRDFEGGRKSVLDEARSGRPMQFWPFALFWTRMLG